jgi:quinol monooxygenase YgiN
MAVPPDKREDVLRTLRLVMGPTAAHTACISCRIHQDIEDENVLIYEEEWESREALEAHIRSNDYRKVLLVMELASEPPEIKFVEALRIDGMELIEEVRG